jgi:hypothetical protein
MQLKNKIKKLEIALKTNSKFCICPGVSYFNLEQENGNLIITKSCAECGKAIEPITWAKLAIQAEMEIEAEASFNSL